MLELFTSTLIIICLFTNQNSYLLLTDASLSPANSRNSTRVVNLKLSKQTSTKSKWRQPSFSSRCPQHQASGQHTTSTGILSASLFSWVSLSCVNNSFLQSCDLSAERRLYSCGQRQTLSLPAWRRAMMRGTNPFCTSVLAIEKRPVGNHSGRYTNTCVFT